MTGNAERVRGLLRVIRPYARIGATGFYPRLILLKLFKYVSLPCRIGAPGFLIALDFQWYKNILNLLNQPKRQ